MMDESIIERNNCVMHRTMIKPVMDFVKMCVLLIDGPNNGWTNMTFHRDTRRHLKQSSMARSFIEHDTPIPTEPHVIGKTKRKVSSHGLYCVIPE